VNLNAGQHRSLGSVGRDDRGQRQEQLDQRPDRLRAQQGVAALGDHHRIHHQRPNEWARSRSATASMMAALESIPVLAASGSDVLKYRVDLRGHDVRRNLVDRPHADRVLGRDGGDHRGAVDAEGGERLEIRLDARAAARVGAGDRQARGRLGTRASPVVPVVPVVPGSSPEWILPFTVDQSLSSLWR
jgi:hypothetical protein